MFVVQVTGILARNSSKGVPESLMSYSIS